jgi:hypothetical protein
VVRTVQKHTTSELGKLKEEVQETLQRHEASMQTALSKMEAQEAMNKKLDEKVDKLLAALERTEQ